MALGGQGRLEVAEALQATADAVAGNENAPDVVEVEPMRCRASTRWATADVLGSGTGTADVAGSTLLIDLVALAVWQRQWK